MAFCRDESGLNPFWEWSVGSQNGSLFNQVSTPGANMIHAMTTVTRSTKAYMNLANPECAQL